MSHANRVCSVNMAFGLDNGLRRWAQNPHKKLLPYIKEGMTVLDIGCGPGFFTLEIAELVGKTGRVFAADLQEEMLQIIHKKISGTALEARITLHKCSESSIGLAEKVDFVFAFYMVHETPSQQAFFTELASIVKPNGQVYIEEPPVHVSKAAFEEMIRIAQQAGFLVTARPKVFLGHAVVLKKG